MPVGQKIIGGKEPIVSVGEIFPRSEGNEGVMPNIHWTDYIILALAIGAVGCLSLIEIRKTFKFGPLKVMVQVMDSFDKKLLKIAGLLFLTFLLSLFIRLMSEGIPLV